MRDDIYITITLPLCVYKKRLKSLNFFYKNYIRYLTSLCYKQGLVWIHKLRRKTYCFLIDYINLYRWKKTHAYVLYLRSTADGIKQTYWM